MKNQQSYPYNNNQDLKYPKEFIKGQINQIRFHPADSAASPIVEKFVDCVSRTIVHDITLIVGWAYFSPYHKKFAKAERLECEIYSRERNGAWKPEQTDVLYIVGQGSEQKIIKQYN